MFGWLRRIFGKTTPIVPAAPGGVKECPHEKEPGSFDVVVQGKVVSLSRSPMCKECTQAHLNAMSTTCATCGEPICPGMAVAKSWVGAKHPHTHMYFDCTDSGIMYCGIWGDGRLITLSELEPDKYPAGDISIVDALLSGDADHISATFEPGKPPTIKE